MSKKLTYNQETCAECRERAKKTATTPPCEDCVIHEQEQSREKIQYKYESHQANLVRRVSELEKAVEATEALLVKTKEEIRRTKEEIKVNQYNYEHGTYIWPYTYSINPALYKSKTSCVDEIKGDKK